MLPISTAKLLSSLCALIAPLVCIGCIGAGNSDTGEVNQLTAQAKRHAMPRLREHGIVELDSDASATEAHGEMTLTATGRDIADEVHDVVIVWRVDTQGTWDMQRMVIDDETEWLKH
jgi:hypothetical protein